MEQADIYGLRSEVRAEAMAILRENPTLKTGSAYIMAAQEWDILWVAYAGVAELADALDLGSSNWGFESLHRYH